MDHSAEAAPSVTFQETFEDLVAVSLLLSHRLYRKQRVRHALIACYFFTIGLFLGYTWWEDGYREPAVVAASFAAMYVLWIGYFQLCFNQLAKRKMAAHLAQFKNIGLAVPTTITLHEQFLETSSALSSGRMTWDVIEAIRHEDGYLIFQVGALGHYVPDRVFNTPQETDAFAQKAIAFASDSRSRTADLRDSPPWAG